MPTSDACPVERVIPPSLLTRVGNPLLTWLLSRRRGAAAIGRSLMLLRVRGRRTGREYTIPVGYHEQPGGALLALTSSTWRLNLRGGVKPVGLTLRGRRVAATAVLQEDPSEVAETYLHLLAQVGLERAERRLGIRVNPQRMPTLEELAEAVRRHHLSVIHLNPGDAQ